MRENNLDLIKRFSEEMSSITEGNVGDILKERVDEYLVELYFNCLDTEKGNSFNMVKLEYMIPALIEMEQILQIECTKNRDEGKPEHLDTIVNINKSIQAGDIKNYRNLMEETGRVRLDKTIVSNILLN